jgi:formylglycine-generating enzyme required for sulfatase activity
MPRLLSLALPVAACAVAAGWIAMRPAAPSAARQRAEIAATPAGFVYVPGGTFLVGADDPTEDESAGRRRRAFVPSFYIGRCEVTQAEWKQFRPAYVVPPGRERYPITEVSLEDAAAYCRWAGGRLPTDAEWEKAARGTDGRRYPWGNAFDATRCNLRPARGRPKAEPGCISALGRKGIKPVDAFPQGASPYGALNMAGNAWEWVSGNYQGNPAQHVIRGGAVGYTEYSGRTYTRGVEGAGVT